MGDNADFAAARSPGRLGRPLDALEDAAVDMLEEQWPGQGQRHRAEAPIGRALRRAPSRVYLRAIKRKSAVSLGGVGGQHHERHTWSTRILWAVSSVSVS